MYTLLCLTYSHSLGKMTHTIHKYTPNIYIIHIIYIYYLVYINVVYTLHTIVEKLKAKIGIGSNYQSIHIILYDAYIIIQILTKYIQV